MLQLLLAHAHELIWAGYALAMIVAGAAAQWIFKKYLAGHVSPELEKLIEEKAAVIIPSVLTKAASWADAQAAASGAKVDPNSQWEKAIEFLEEEIKAHGLDQKAKDALAALLKKELGL